MPVLVLLGTASSSAVSIRHDIPLQDYLDLAAPFDAVGRFEDNFGSGTGMFVSTTQILTAAHVVDGNADGIPDAPLNEYAMRLGADVATPTVVLTNIVSIAIHPMWNQSSQYDMAVITVGTPYLGVTPMKLSTQNPIGLAGTMIGYGASGTGAAPFEDNFDGLRRAATNVLDQVGTASIETDFDSPFLDTNTYGSNIPLALEGTTAAGDSGGPFVVDFGAGNRVVGVLHGGYNNFGEFSEYGDVSIWAPINDPDNITFLTGQGIPVPEPSAPGLMGLALVFGAGRRFRRRLG